MKRTVLTLLVVFTVLLAGCSAVTSGNGDAGNGDDAPDGTDGGGNGAATMGTVEFYVSDQPVAINDFEHLNVTISKIGFQQSGNATAGGNGTATPTNGTSTPTATPTNATATPSDADGGPPADAGPPGDDDGGNADDDDKSGSWIEHNVSNRTVDLTMLKGNNATLIGSPQVPAGQYNKVFLYVSSVSGELKDGSQPEFKVPSQKLQLTKSFTVQANSSVSFVYDINVIKRGNSGKYNLLPVIDQSGPNQDIKKVNATAKRKGN